MCSQNATLVGVPLSRFVFHTAKNQMPTGNVMWADTQNVEVCFKWRQCLTVVYKSTSRLRSTLQPVWSSAALSARSPARSLTGPLQRVSARNQASGGGLTHKQTPGLQTAAVLFHVRTSSQTAAATERSWRTAASQFPHSTTGLYFLEMPRPIKRPGS